jgi:hypothetical protein
MDDDWQLQIRKQNTVRYNHIFEPLPRSRALSYTIVVRDTPKSYGADCEH